MNEDAKFIFENWLISTQVALSTLLEIFNMAYIQTFMPITKRKQGRTVIEWPNVEEFSHPIIIDYFRRSMDREEFVIPKIFVEETNDSFGKIFLSALYCADVGGYLSKIHLHLTTEHSSGSCGHKRCFLLGAVPNKWIQEITGAIEILFLEARKVNIPIKYQEADRTVKKKIIDNIDRLKKANRPRKERKIEREVILERELKRISKDPLWSELSAYKRAKILHGIVAGNPNVKGGFETIKKWVLSHDKSGKS